MGNFKKILIGFLIIWLVSLASAAHWITGYVNDALDGESANGKIVTLWKPSNGQSYNVTDVVGITGNSRYPNVYMIDCEMLVDVCVAGEIVSLKIFGEDYISNTVNVTVTVAGYDLADNLSVNSPPIPGLIFPLDGDNVPEDIDFNCSYFDFDDDIEYVSLWGNWEGTWEEISGLSLGPESGYAVFSETLTQGSYEWNCLVRDALGIEKFSTSNNSFFVDTTDPIIDSVDIEQVQVCGFGNIRVNCTAYDEHTYIDNVIIESLFEGSPVSNYTANYFSGNVYYYNVPVDEVGNWSFRCYVSDAVGNNASLLGEEEAMIMSGNPEVSILNSEVNFDKVPSVEGEDVNVSVIVQNTGCGVASNFIVGFFNGESPGGDNFANKTVSIPVLSSLTVSSIFQMEIGTSNIFVYADLEDTLNEDNESNNVGNNSLYLKAWQKIYGNLSLDKILTGETSGINMSLWSGASGFAGNVFIADSESDIQWTNLQAIGRTKTGTVSSDDFSELDDALNMDSYNDSIYELFSTSGSPNFVSNLTVFKKDIVNVPMINSSSDGNFQTGILWDMGDSVDSEYDSTENEDIVFVTQINMEAVGEYGVYDYEIDVPAKLRDYNNVDDSQVYLYYDLN